MNALLAALEPHLTEVLTALMIALASMLAAMVRRALAGVPDLLRQHLGAQAERVWREALHSALESGALQQFDWMDIDDQVGGTIGYARKSTPQAIAALGATDDILDSLARAKLARLRAKALPSTDV